VAADRLGGARVEGRQLKDGGAMVDHSLDANLATPGAALLRWLGLAIAAVVAAIGAGLGFWQGLPAQQVIFYTAATIALVLWIWNAFLVRLMAEIVSRSAAARAGGAVSARTAIRRFVVQNRGVLGGLLIIIGGFIILSLTLSGFFTLVNLITGLVLCAALVVTALVSRAFVDNRSAFIGLMVLGVLFVVASLHIDGFLSGANFKSMLVFASFLGLASVGQTLVALLGGLDLSIPYIIGSSNVGLLYLMSLGIPSPIAVIIILLLGGAIGFVNGLLSFRLQAQALIVTLGIGFAISGGTQILTSIGTAYAGNVFGEVPGWLKNLAAMNGSTFGLNVPPVIFIWIAVAIVLIFGMKNSVYGRYIYALGGNRTSAQRISISERRYWIGAFTISGCASALTGSLLLGWSGGGFIGVGDPYLFTTLAAVVIGGTSLLGGQGGYGFTVIGVLVLQVLTSFLVGIGLKFEWQQFIYGLLILPMVALYARSPHIRTQI
jgi:ribose transport system permease protein